MVAVNTIQHNDKKPTELRVYGTFQRMSGMLGNMAEAPGNVSHLHTRNCMDTAVRMAHAISSLLLQLAYIIR